MATDIIAVPDRIEIVSTSGGDWVGVYLNGTLAQEGHSLEPEDLLNLIGVPFNTRTVEVLLDGRLPSDLRELDAPAPQTKTVESSWCEACQDEPAGLRWLCRNRPHPLIEQNA